MNYGSTGGIQGSRKIGISYKGDYNPNTVYERLDAVYHNGSTYLAIKDAPDGAPRNDKINWIYLAKGYDGETVDVADSEIAFTDSETRENIVSGEKVSTVFGKIKKFFTDLTAPAFAQMITTKEDLLATKVTGYVPDAKAVADAYTELNGKLIASDNVPFRFGVNSNGEYGYIITNPAGADTVIPFSSEASYAAALYNALKPSGLVNANMTFNQLIAVVASQNPATYSLIRSGWTVDTAGGAITPSASSNGSAVTLKIASQTGMSSYVYYTSPAINLSSFKTLTLQGSSYKVTGNPYGSDDYRPKVKLLNASGVEVTTYMLIRIMIRRKQHTQ